MDGFLEDEQKIIMWLTPSTRNSKLGLPVLLKYYFDLNANIYNLLSELLPDSFFFFFITGDSINLGSFSRSKVDGIGVGWGKLSSIRGGREIGVVCPVSSQMSFH